MALLAQTLPGEGPAQPSASETAGGTDARRSETWRDTTITAADRADALVKAMTKAERLKYVHGIFPPMANNLTPDMIPPVGYEPGVPRLGIPTLTSTAARRALPQWEAAGWRLKGGTYAVKLATDAQTAIAVGTVRLTEQRLASVRAAFDTP